MVGEPDLRAGRSKSKEANQGTDGLRAVHLSPGYLN